MIITAFKNQSPITLFALPFFISLLGIKLWFQEPQDYEYSYSWLTNVYSTITSNKFALYFTTIGVIYWNAVLLNIRFNRSDFYSKNSYLPGLIYTLFLFNLDLFFFSPNLLSHTFIILALGQILNLRRQEDAKDIIFKASLALGIAFMLTPAFMPLLLLPWFSLIVIRPFVWREYIVVLLGIALPEIFHIGIYYSLTGTALVTLQDLSLLSTEFSFSWSVIISFAVLGLLFLYGVWKYLVVFGAEVVRFKKLSRIIFHFSWLSLLASLIEWYLYQQLVLSIAIPLSIIFSVAFLHTKNLLFINGLVLIWFISSALNLFL